MAVSAHQAAKDAETLALSLQAACPLGSSCPNPCICGKPHKPVDYRYFFENQERLQQEDREYNTLKRLEEARKLASSSEPIRTVFTRAEPFLPHNPEVDNPLLFNNARKTVDSNDDNDDVIETTSAESQRKALAEAKAKAKVNTRQPRSGNIQKKPTTVIPNGKGGHSPTSPTYSPVSA